MSERKVWWTLVLLAWVIQPCGTLEEVAKFLNKLPTAQAINAKVVVINSQRSFFGVWSTPYYVFYDDQLR